MSHTLTLKSIDAVTHDTYHLVFDRPDGFDFTPGQAVDLALDRDGWREEKRPFTFTSLPGDDDLEFVIKSYPDHDGVTEQIAKRPGKQRSSTIPGARSRIAARAGSSPAARASRRSSRS